jgi:hypothetical protein
MGDVVEFPAWRAVTREEGSTRGEPRVLVDPAGRTHEIEDVLRRRLVASRDPLAPIRHEMEVRIDTGLFRVTWTDPAGRWVVEPI